MRLLDLQTQSCEACEGDETKLLGDTDIQQYLEQLPNWQLADTGTKIFREYTFVNFVQAIDFVNQVADVAESEGHHPDIAIHYNRVTITLWTHALGGLSLNDFIVAAKLSPLRPADIL